jgi:hypothetical protein
MVTSSSPSNLYVMWQEKVGSQWATKWAYSTNWANTTPRGTITMDLFAIWANDYYGDDAGAVYFTRTYSTSVDEMVKVEDLKDYRIYTVDGKLVKGNLNELPRGVYFLKGGRRVVKVVR